MDLSPVMRFRTKTENCAHVHERIIDGDDKDLSRAFQGLAVEVAGYVRLGARRAWLYPVSSRSMLP